jgi:hypothetical protein
MNKQGWHKLDEIAEECAVAWNRWCSFPVCKPVVFFILQRLCAKPDGYLWGDIVQLAVEQLTWGLSAEKIDIYIAWLCRQQYISHYLDIHGDRARRHLDVHGEDYNNWRLRINSDLWLARINPEPGSAIEPVVEAKREQNPAKA